MTTTVFNSKTLVPVGVVAVVVVGLTTATVNVALQLHGWMVGDTLWKSGVTRDLQTLKDRSADRWRRSEQQSWRDRLSDLNQGKIDVPPLSDPQVSRTFRPPPAPDLGLPAAAASGPPAGGAGARDVPIADFLRATN